MTHEIDLEPKDFATWPPKGHVLSMIMEAVQKSDYVLLWHINQQYKIHGNDLFAWIHERPQKQRNKKKATRHRSKDR